MATLTGYSDGESFYAALGVDLEKLEREKEQIGLRVKEVAAKVDAFFQSLEKDPSAYELSFESDPLKCFGLDKYVEPPFQSEVSDDLKRLVPRISAEPYSLKCAWCKTKTYASMVVMAILWTALVAAAGAILGGAIGGPPVALMGAIIGALAGVAIYIAMKKLAELVLAAFGYSSLAEAICYWDHQCP